MLENIIDCLNHIMIASASPKHKNISNLPVDSVVLVKSACSIMFVVFEPFWTLAASEELAWIPGNELMKALESACWSMITTMIYSNIFFAIIIGNNIRYDT